MKTFGLSPLPFYKESGALETFDNQQTPYIISPFTNGVVRAVFDARMRGNSSAKSGVQSDEAFINGVETQTVMQIMNDWDTRTARLCENGSLMNRFSASNRSTSTFLTLRFNTL